MDKLIIYATHGSSSSFDIRKIIDNLRSLQFIGESYDQQNEFCYLIGERFLDYISFVGCSPKINTEPSYSGDRNFYHVCLNDFHHHLEFIAGSVTKSPACPNCRATEEQWKDLVSEWKADKQHYQWHCPNCHKYIPVPEMNWKKSAVFSKFSIAVHNIFPNEAVPNEELLKDLHHGTGAIWKYVYLQI